MLLGWRPHDLDTAYLPFLAGVGIAVGMSDPVFMSSLGLKADPDPPITFPFDPEKHRALLQRSDDAAVRATYIGSEWLKQTNSGLFRSWSDVKFVRDNWDGPLVLKGIQSVEDAHAAMDVGVDGIVVSNHGGRQLDMARSGIEVLVEVVDALKERKLFPNPKFEIYVDGGVRRATDVLKAIALGAKAVGIGRGFLYSFCAYGEDGVEHAFKILRVSLIASTMDYCRADLRCHRMSSR